MGSDREDLNLLRFKEKWGSQSLDIHTYVKDYHPLRCLLWETGKRWMASSWEGAMAKDISKIEIEG